MVWDGQTGRELRTLSGSGSMVGDVAVSADGRVAVSAYENGSLRVWDVDSG